MCWILLSFRWSFFSFVFCFGRLRLKCDGTRAETGFRLSTKWMSPFKSAGASVQSTTCSRGVRISGSNAGYTMFRGNVKGTGYPLHSPVSPSLPLPCVTVCRHVSTGLCVQLAPGGTRWRIWLRHCATSQKVMGSISDGVTGIFH